MYIYSKMSNLAYPNSSKILDCSPLRWRPAVEPYNTCLKCVVDGKPKCDNTEY